MAQSGLFTAGTSIEELLAKRNSRASALQRSLMTQASQGAARPDQAQAASLLGSSLGRALAGRLEGGDPEMEKLKAANAQQLAMQGEYASSLGELDPKKKMASAIKLIDLGYVDYGNKLRTEALSDAEKIKAEKVKKALLVKEQERREKLRTIATDLGLMDTASLLQDGGDLEEAGKVIREQEKLKILQGGNRKSRALMAKQYGKSGAYIQEVMSGKHDTVSDDMFLKVLEGKEAKLTNYMNKAGNAQLYRVDAQGKVWNADSSSWVFPSELGLSAAPQQTQEIMSMFDQVTTALVTADIENYQELNTKANEALQGLDMNAQSQRIFDEGIIAGKFAEVRVGINKSLMAAGMASEDAEAITANTETWLAYRGNAVASTIQAFGAGSGLSDADREFATKMAGANPDASPAAIKRLLEIERRGYTSLIKNNNRVVKRMVDRIEGTDAEKQKLAMSYYIAEPEEPVQQQSSDAIVNKWLNIIKPATTP